MSLCAPLGARGRVTCAPPEQQGDDWRQRPCVLGPEGHFQRLHWAASLGVFDREAHIFSNVSVGRCVS